MTSFAPLYRMSVYAPRSVDPDEATILTPRAGALHSNPFRVATKKHGRAVRIGATTARHLIRNPVGTWPTTSLTVEYFGRLDSGLNQAQANYGFSYARQTTQFNEIACNVDSNATNWRQGLFINGTSVFDTDNYPNDNKYHHLAWTWRSSDGAWVMYLDGVQVASGAGLQTGYSIAAGGIVVLGQDQDSAGGSFDATQAWKGELDEVRVYTRVLSPAEIKQHAGGIYMDETGLCARWGFDLGGVPALGYDSSSAANHLTPVGITEGTEDTLLHFRPYLREPEGRRGIFDPLSRKLDTGVMVAGLTDAALAIGNNLERWFTTYLGDSKTRNQLLGLLARWEESLDDGFTWAPYYTARIDLTTLEARNQWRVPARDGADELADADVFVGRPHSSVMYAAAPQVWPVGPSAAFGALKAALPIKGKIQAATGFAASAGIKSVLVDTAELANPRNRMTPTLEEVSGAFITSLTGVIGDTFTTLFPEGVRYSGAARVKLKRLDTQASGEFKLGIARRGSAPPSGVLGLSPLGGIGFGNAVAEVVLAPLDATDPKFLAMPPDTTAVEISIISVEAEPDEDAPILIGDVHVVTLIRNMLEGKFGWLRPDGSVSQAFAPEPVSFAALEADATIPPFRGVIEKRDKLKPFVEENLLRPPYNLGWRLDASNRVVIFNTRRPSTLAGIGTITDADLVKEENAFRWEQSRHDAVTQLEGFYYVDLPVGPDGAIIAPARMGTVATLLLRSVQQPYLDLTFGRTDMGQKRETFDAIGFRAMPGEIVEGQSRITWIERQLARGLEEIRTMFSTGPATATIRCLRNANTNTWQVGQYKIVDVDPMPDPASNLRGGARLMLALARNENKAEIGFRVIDAGPNVIAAAPTSASLTTDANDTAHGFSLAVTLNAASDPVILEYAITDSGVGSRPAEGSSAWTFAQRITASATVKVINLPAGKKVWPRHRSVPASETNQQLPSVWSFPTTTESVTLTALAACTGLGTTEVSGKRAVVTFTPGDVRLPTEVWLATPTSDPRVRVKTLPPGAARGELVGLTVSTEYRLGLIQRDSLGGTSPEATVDFTTTATPLTAPNPGGIAIVIGAA